MSWYHSWKPYMPVAVRRTAALKKMQKLRKKGLNVQPVEIEGRKIARTFWGEAWCDHLESFSDYENRLPRGRTYVRNGSVCHLDIAKGRIEAMVSGSELYKVKVAINTLAVKKWKDVKQRCAGQIGSLIELLQGRLSENVMAVVTDRKQGLFPLPREISLACNCPDWAVMCKHVAAVLYGVGARLDQKPELLFLLRGVDHEELIGAEVGVATAAGKVVGGRKRIADDALADVFGIEISQDDISAGTSTTRRRKKPVARKTVKISSKRKARSRKSTSPARKKSASRNTGARRTDKGTRPVTGRAVAGLRAKFNMSQSDFAKLLGVSTPSIGNWERKSGALNLQPRTRDALEAVKGLTQRQARRKLKHA